MMEGCPDTMGDVDVNCVGERQLDSVMLCSPSTAALIPLRFCSCLQARTYPFQFNETSGDWPVKSCADSCSGQTPEGERSAGVER